jgi:hypothetical protein
MYLRITFKEAPTSNSLAPTNPLCSPTPTGRWLQPGRRLQPPVFSRLQPEGGYNHPILWLQLEGGSNPLCSLAPTGRWLQPPNSLDPTRRRLQPEGSSNSLVLQLQLKGGSNHLSFPRPAALKYKCQM